MTSSPHLWEGFHHQQIKAFHFVSGTNSPQYHHGSSLWSETFNSVTTRKVAPIKCLQRNLIQYS